MKLAKLVIAVALCNLFALGQIVNNKGTKEQDTFIVTVSGSPVIMYDSIGTQTNSFEIVPTGSPATVSVVVVGCMRSGTCSATLTSTTSTSSSVLFTTSGPYDYYQITPSWTGGSNPTIKINRTGTAARSNSGGAAVSVPFSGITSGINTSAQMQVSGTAALSPLNLGQVVGNQVWVQPGLSIPAQGQFSAVNSGGNIGTGHVIFTQYTLNSALGETLPSPSFSPNLGTAGCTIGNCTLTMSAPTIPSGYTGWTMYFCDQSGGGGCGTTPIKVLACGNISTSCSITNAALNSGVALPTINTAILQPLNVQATECPPGVIPSLFSVDASGNYHTWAGVDYVSTNGQTSGTPTFCHRTWFNDTLVAGPGGNNAFVLIDHLTGVGTSTTNQDRALWANIRNGTSDTSAHYGMESIQAETDLQGAPSAINGAPDGEVAGGSFQLNDSTTAGGTTPSFGLAAIRATNFRTTPTGGTSGAGWGKYYGVNADVTNSGNFAVTGGTQFIALKGGWSNTGTGTNMQGFGLDLIFPVTAQKAGALNIGIEIPSAAMTVTQGSDWLIDNLLSGLPTNLSGPVSATALTNNNASAAFNVNAPVNVIGSLTVAQASSLQPSSVNCAGGASTYSYEFIGVDANGGTVASVAQNSTGTCTNPLAGGTPATINVSGGFANTTTFASFIRIDVYRTAGPMGLGKIGSLSCVGANRNPGPSCSAFSDTGIVATGTVPTINTTGGANLGGDLTLGTSKGQHINTQSANSDHTGTCTLGTNCVVTFTRAYTAAPVCVATDTTAIAAVRVVTTTTTATFTGTGTDVLGYICTGNPN